MMMMMMNK